MGKKGKKNKNKNKKAASSNTSNNTNNSSVSSTNKYKSGSCGKKNAITKEKSLLTQIRNAKQQTNRQGKRELSKIQKENEGCLITRKITWKQDHRRM